MYLVDHTVSYIFSEGILLPFCLQSVWMQYYRGTVSHPDFSSEIKHITPERAGPEWK